MKLNKNLLIGYKTCFALLGFSAIVTEIATLAERGQFNPANFFSYFTVETNILVIATLLLSAIATAAGNNDRLAILRSATTVYILIVGIGFSLLLSQVEGLTLTAVPWDNIVLHYIIPVAVLVDFLLDRPKHRASFKKSLVWLLFPILYASYALTRGALTGWYPYPFLDPATKGYGAVALAVVSLLVLGVMLVWGVNRLLYVKSSRSTS